MSITTTIKLWIEGEQAEAEEKACEVTVWQEAAEKGYGICPDYDASCGIESIMSEGKDVTDLFTQDDKDSIAEAICNDEYNDAMEAQAIKHFERKQEYLEAA